MRTWSFQSAGSLIFGRGAAAQIPDTIRGLGAKRAFVVTDAILDRAGVVKTVAELEKMLEAGEIETGHTLICCYWLLGHRERVRRDWLGANPA